MAGRGKRSPSRIHRGGAAAQTARAVMLSAEAGRVGGYQHIICVLCGHPGAMEADHIVPLAVDPDQYVDPDALQPAHGSSCPCTHPDCVYPNGKGRSCNQVRGARQPRHLMTDYTPDLTW